MNLKFVGVGSAFSGECNNSAFLINNRNMLLIDCGETVFSTLVKSKILENVDNLYVFITHTHSDHIGSLSSLIYYFYYAKGKKVSLIYDKNYKIKDDIELLLKIHGHENGQYVFENVDDVKNCLGLSGISICEVKHMPNMKSYAIKLDECVKNNETRSVVFTGDTCDMDFVLKALKDENLQKIYVDVSLHGGVHLSYEEAVQKLAPYKDKVVFMHLENGFIKNRLTRNGFTYARQAVEMEDSQQLF